MKQLQILGNFHLSSFIYLILFLVFTAGTAFSLEEYHLSIDPEALSALYADPLSPAQYPAVLTCSVGTSECLVRFRGRSTIVHPKKSWAITLPNPDLLGRERLNLNSEYLDPGMMRNCIAMLASALLGLPASKVSHTKFFVNGEYFGVYLDVERVDEYYFERLGYNSIAVFKAHEQSARFMQFQSGTLHEDVYRPQADSEVYISLLENFIDCICAGMTPLPVDAENIMGNYAVNLALMELDSGSSNFYLSIGSDGRWSVFPWDRGICLGGGGGQFFPGYVDDTYLALFRANSLYQKLILSSENMAIFNSYLNQVTDLLSAEIPDMLDSIYSEISFELYNDPLSPWTQTEIDEAYIDLVWFVNERAAFLQNSIPAPQTASVLQFEIADPWLEPGDSTLVRVLIDNRFERASLKWLEDEGTHFIVMNPVSGLERLSWVTQFVMPEGVDHCPLAIFFNTTKPERQYFFYPSYGLEMYPYLSSAQPSIVRISPGFSSPGGEEDCDFTVLPPQEYGPNLWSLPLVNSSGTDLDISCCVFVFGDSPSRIFVPSGTVCSAGDTLFLTNSLSLFTAEFPSRSAFGNCAGSSPENSTLTMLDPGWGELWEMTVPAGDDIDLPLSPVLVTEINFMPCSEFNCGDWVEFYNPTSSAVDISGFVLSDSEGNNCVVPFNTVIQPFDFCVLVRDPSLFCMALPDCSKWLPGLGLGLDSELDTFSVIDRCGRKLFSLTWDSSDFSPPGRRGVLGLVAPGLSSQTVSSWELAPFPGSPGESNRLWEAGGEALALTTIYPNPSYSGSISYEFTSLSWPVRAFILDMSGRIMLDRGLLDKAGGLHIIELPEELPSGLYFLVLQSAGNTATQKFIRL